VIEFYNERVPMLVQTF